MRNISDIIEHYIKQMLKSGPSNFVEIQRNELADRFHCVPSQINYVISTRFTLEKGYVVESKRGGGGYIRIRRLDLNTDAKVIETILNLFGSRISQREAIGIIHRLLEEEILTPREARMLEAAMLLEELRPTIPEPDTLRASLLSAMFRAILKG
ncbi:CtsR family transcriptional regulator [Effusibacillus lacus]|uniref:Transcriptional regulator CtsR n=1 Tax=Effusibacillus lacus TaxID=1348429 RepID=A0A292YLI8_9BACL|nr:CtsR family transcriptional regulator [Effusibacillus lacus]TCS69140.1 transcriptional regulator CtsR [Effusibacillus lacus]GAX89355.1 hypothetical protein EFBL_0973 [Effusibacillus lacus]